jgi:hypothetical protein
LQDGSGGKRRTYSGKLTFAAKSFSDSLRPYEQTDELDCRGS